MIKNTTTILSLLVTLNKQWVGSWRCKTNFLYQTKSLGTHNVSLQSDMVFVLTPSHEYPMKSLLPDFIPFVLTFIFVTTVFPAC